MFERDKDALRSVGIPLRTVPAPGDTGDVGYALDRREYELAEIDLTVEEMSALAVAVGAITDRELARGLAKVAAVAPDPRPTGGAAITSSLPSGVDPLVQAIEDRQAVSFRYASGSGEVGQRTIDPWLIAWRRGRAYVIGHDHERQAQRVFRLDRIEGIIRPVGHAGAFEPHAEIDVKAATSRPGLPAVPATFVVDRRHRWIVERAGGVTVGEEGEQARLELSAPLDVVTELACELGERGRVTAPPQAVEATRSALAAIVAAHRDTDA
jgi:predicted DNA-binding transcriptional regulator YafY